MTQFYAAMEAAGRAEYQERIARANDMRAAGAEPKAFADYVRSLKPKKR